MTKQIDKYKNLSKDAKARIKWFDYYKKTNNISLTCRHFDISRKTFHKWKKVYSPDNLFTLENSSKAPKKKRQPEITNLQEKRIIQLRKKRLRYSKIKLAGIYKDTFQETISSWKIQRVIQKHQLYYNPKKTARITGKRLNSQKKKRITELKKKKRAGFLLCLDAVELRYQNTKRYIFTAIDNYSKVAFARMYKRASSYNASEFLNRLLYLTESKIENIQTDNGSKFQKYFQRACKNNNLNRYYSRARTPKDNSVNERFNRTLQDEFISLGNYSSNVLEFNKQLTLWLIEYNFNRPHMSLNYETPISFNNSTQVLPMYPSRTSP
jgi:transposase InsO family protein